MLSAFELRCLSAVFDAILPSGVTDEVPIGARDVPLDRFALDLIRHAPGHVRMGLRACIWVLTLCPPWIVGRWKTFAGLSPEERLDLLDRLGRSSVYVMREIPLFFKTLACLGFCGLPRVQSGVGIFPVDSTPPEWAGGPRRGAGERRRQLPLAREPR